MFYAADSNKPLHVTETVLKKTPNNYSVLFLQLITHSSLPASSTGSAWPFSLCSSLRWVSVIPSLNAKNSLTYSWCSVLSINAMLCSMWGASGVRRQTLVRILKHHETPHALCHSLIRFWLVEVNPSAAPLILYLMEETMKSHNRDLHQYSGKKKKTCVSAVVKSWHSWSLVGYSIDPQYKHFKMQMELFCAASFK